MSGTLPVAIDGERREELRAQLTKLGFDEVRFAAVSPLVPTGLSPWLAAGHHADMAWMERTAGKRSDPDQVLAGAQTVIALGVNYWTGAATDAEKRDARWARYACYEDYHDTIKPGLIAAGRLLESAFGSTPEDYRYYVDTGPVLERGWAARSGIGFRGKNGMLISRRHGNWLFLACILTRLRVSPDEPLRPDHARPQGNEPAGLLCGHCRRCLDACPTAAFVEPGEVDSRRCVSYQTIENKGVIPRELRLGVGDRVYGCDTCLDVCPWNRFAAAGRRLLLAARDEISAESLVGLLDLTPEEFSRRFHRTPIKRLKLERLLRNACVAAGNSGDNSLLPRLAGLAAHPSPLVRAHAVWAVGRLAGPAAVALLAEVRQAETAAVVLAEYEANRAETVPASAG